MKRLLANVAIMAIAATPVAASDPGKVWLAVAVAEASYLDVICERHHIEGDDLEDLMIEAGMPLFSFDRDGSPDFRDRDIDIAAETAFENATQKFAALNKREACYHLEQLFGRNGIVERNLLKPGN